MAKTNFTKVEDALNDGMKRMAVKKLLEEADIATGKKAPPKEDTSLILTAVKHDLKWLAKQNPEIYKELSLDKQKTHDLLKAQPPFNQEQMTELKQVKEKIEHYKVKIKAQSPESDNERIVQEEKKSQKNKRFNVRDKWLPLH